MKKQIYKITKSISLLMLLTCCGTQNSDAVNTEEFLINAPDSLMPYFARDQRRELVSLRQIDNSTPATIQTMYRQNASITEMTDDYLILTIDSYRMNILRLPVNDNDSVFCILGTCATPEPETTATIYSNDYELISELSFYSDNYTHKPDTMSQQEYEDRQKLIEFPIIEATAEKENPQVLQITVHAPALAKEDRERLNAIIMQRKVKWDGKTFK